MRTFYPGSALDSEGNVYLPEEKLDESVLRLVCCALKSCSD